MMCVKCRLGIYSRCVIVNRLYMCVCVVYVYVTCDANKMYLIEVILRNVCVSYQARIPNYNPGWIMVFIIELAITYHLVINLKSISNVFIFS